MKDTRRCQIARSVLNLRASPKWKGTETELIVETIDRLSFMEVRTEEVREILEMNLGDILRKD